jgi:antitoxin (DNA-binding transcriptional repressor) of toxin-antitoxin stability system
MKTIGAKEFRLHLSQIFDRVVKGEEIIVNHRFKGPIRLRAVHDSSANLKERTLEGLKAFDMAKKTKSPYDPNKSIKELYDVSISKKYSC